MAFLGHIPSSDTRNAFWKYEVSGWICSRHETLGSNQSLRPEDLAAEEALTQSSHGRVWWSHSSSEKSAHWKSQKSRWAGVQTLVSSWTQKQGTASISHEQILLRSRSWIDPIPNRGFKAGVSGMVYHIPIISPLYPHYIPIVMAGR